MKNSQNKPSKGSKIVKRLLPIVCTLPLITACLMGNVYNNGNLDYNPYCLGNLSLHSATYTEGQEFVVDIPVHSIPRYGDTEFGTQIKGEDFPEVEYWTYGGAYEVYDAGEWGILTYEQPYMVEIENADFIIGIYNPEFFNAEFHITYTGKNGQNNVYEDFQLDSFYIREVIEPGWNGYEINLLEILDMIDTRGLVATSSGNDYLSYKGEQRHYKILDIQSLRITYYVEKIPPIDINDNAFTFLGFDLDGIVVGGISPSDKVRLDRYYNSLVLDHAINPSDIFDAIFGSIGNFLNIELLPGFKLSNVLQVALGALFIGLFMKLFVGG